MARSCSYNYVTSFQTGDHTGIFYKALLLKTYVSDDGKMSISLLTIAYIYENVDFNQSCYII